MKFGIWILWLTIVALLAVNVLYFFVFCVGDGPDPIDIESVLTVAIGTIGIAVSALLIRKSKVMRPWLFWLCILLVFFLFTFPAIVASAFVIIFA